MNIHAFTETPNIAGKPTPITTKAYEHRNQCWNGDPSFEYFVSKNVAIELDASKHSKFTTQQLAKCARKCLQIKESDSNATPYWVSSYDKPDYTVPNDSRTYVKCNFDEIINEPINHAEKPYRLLDRLAKNMELKGAYDKFTLNKKDMYLVAIPSTSEFAKIVKYLCANEFLEHKKYQVSNPKVDSTNVLEPEATNLTINAWAKIHEQNTFPKTNKVFVAMAFKWDIEAGVSQTTALDAIKGACNELGYDADIVSQNHTGNITDRIMNEIKNSRFVVADFTYNNRGVYFEAGYARALGREVFHTVHENYKKLKSGNADTDILNDRNGEIMHFDIQQLNYRDWKKPDDLKEKLKEWIEARVGRFGEKK